MKIGFYEYIKEYIINFDYRPTAIMLVLCALLFNQALARSFEQTPRESSVSIKIAEMSISDALSLLEEKAGLSINYNRSIFSQNNKISLEVKNMPLELILKKILSGTRVTYRFADTNTILLYKLPDPVKPGRISGKIFDEKGETLPGASIKVIETGKATQTTSDGGYSLSVEPGTYTVEVSYISFVTQRISEVNVKADKNTPLDISLKPEAKGLQDVVVTASYKKASVEGLLARQKNASEISNGISAEQIARTPDKNIGESLKRISGVNTVENKFILVRGIGERYNAAQMDGVSLPSTEGQTRNFSFDLIPTNLVDNVVVSKTVTPDMNASFGGGLIQINTKDIPTDNFTNFTAGTSYNDQSTGKDFLSHKRGKYDYFGFDDGRRAFPKDLMHTDRTTAPNNSLSPEEYQRKIDEQSKRFTVDNFTVYKYKTAPSQNYQLTVGRFYGLDTVKKNKIGFTASLSYRNTQNINQFDQQHRRGWLTTSNNSGSTYRFNTTLGGLLNAGLQIGKNRFSFRNTYTHLYDNAMVRTVGYDDLEGNNFLFKGLPPNRIQEVDDPTFTNLLQNKLSGQHQLGKVKIDWNVSRTGVDRKEKDIIIAEQTPILIGNEYMYFYLSDQINQGYINPASRHNYQNKESHYSAGLDASIPFKLGPLRNTVKTGYFGINKKSSFDWQIAAFAHSISMRDSLFYIPVSEMVNPANFGANGYNYTINGFFLDTYEGKSTTQAGYVMLDNRFSNKLRLVWGVRGEYYKYTEIKNGTNRKEGNTKFKLPVENKWQWLPSANLTYSPIDQINIRLAASRTVVRPELLDNSQFFRYNAPLGAAFGNLGLVSTSIKSYDFKTEWFPGLGEIISAGVFYKHFDKPTEMIVLTLDGDNYLKNADNAKVYGLELELRKNLSFITDNKILAGITLYGNLTLQKSSVTGSFEITNPVDPKLGDVLVTAKQKRSMYGQSPYLINAGLQYDLNRFGFNVAYNKSGRKTYIVGQRLDFIEYEKPRDQIDAQLSYQLLKKRLEMRVSAGNLLNKASTYYINTGSYEKNPNYDFSTRDISNTYILKQGFTDDYEEGDLIRFSQKFGRTYSLSINYNF